MDTLIQDVRFGLRTCLRAPGFTTVAIVALALGIGANTAIFTIVNAVLIERLPFRDPQRLVVVWEENARKPGRANVVAPANFLRWRDRAAAFEELAGFYDYTLNLTDESAEPQEVVSQEVTSNFFATLGVAPALGRTFGADEGLEGHDRVVVLTHALWQRRFGGDPGVIGRSVRLNGHSFTVIGVMPADVGLLLTAGTLVGKPADLWTVFAFTEAQRVPRGRYMSAIARLKPGVPVEAAQAQMSTIAAGLSTEFPEFDTGWTVTLVPIRSELSGEVRPALLVLVGAVAFVLLIACANVANLLLARGAGRRREIAIRAALGAVRSRMMRQLLTESLVLGIAGGLAGLLVAQWSVAALVALSPINLTGLGHIQLSYTVLAFTAIVSLLTAVACGLAPALEGSRADVQDALRDGARQVGAGVRSRLLRHAFVVSEVALATVLLVGAGLMLRSFVNLRGVDLGFESGNVLTLRTALPRMTYQTDAQRTRFFASAVERIAALPGVRAAGAISYLPLAGLGAATSFRIAGEPPPLPGQSPVTGVRVCDNGYFQAMSVRLVRGRLFTDREQHEAGNVVVVNEAMVRRYFPNGDPIGRRLMIEMTDPVVPTAIVGVVGDVKYSDVTGETTPMAYWPHPQLAYSAMTFTVRTASDPLAMAGVIQHEIQSVDKDQPVSDVRTMDQWVSRSLGQARFSSLLLALFAGLALILAAIGIYGVMAYAVSQRTAEIGLRLALGADRRTIVGMILGDTCWLVGIGLLAGVPLAFALKRTLESLLYHTQGTDPATYAGSAVVLSLMALTAGVVPAWRASRIPPGEALRDQ